MQDAQTFAEVLRTPYFPRPFDAPLAVVPSFNWHLLPGGVSNVFWHAVTPSNSLVVVWENAPVNYNVSCLTNFQAEFFAGGRFDYRYQNRTVEYAPVFPFDWDNDGLENSVDPDSLAAGPDAHGTNAEWYNTLCSNVLSAVEGGATGTTGILPVGDECVLSWRNGVNSNAYYFVNVVASNGPAPIYFVGDRESRLGNPVVVALAGITNRVPLLIGVNYAITSTVPISVSIPDDGFATITTNTASNYAVHWPLEFTVAPDGMGYSVSAGPYDPGCEFQWQAPTRSATCSYTTDGGWIGFSCGGVGSCECGGCSVSGVAMLEDVSFSIEYEAETHSDFQNDISVSASMLPGDGGTPCTESASVTAAEILIEAEANFPTNKHRHVFGPAEMVSYSINPPGVSFTLQGNVPAQGEHDHLQGRIGMPFCASQFSLMAVNGDTSLSLPFTVIEPEADLSIDSVTLPSEDDWKNVMNASPLKEGDIGSVFHVNMTLKPSYVSFDALGIMELYAAATNVQGFFTNAVFHGHLDHDTEAGAFRPISVNEDNTVGTGDNVLFTLNNALLPYLRHGTFKLEIPVVWYVEDESFTNSLAVLEARNTVYGNADVTV